MVKGHHAQMTAVNRKTADERRIRKRALGATLCVCLSACFFAPVMADDALVQPLTAQTDQQIGGLLQRWPELDAAQRRDLLAEVRKRMNLAKANANATAPTASVENLLGSAPSLTVRIKRAQTLHRYGSSSAGRDDQQQRLNQKNAAQAQALDKARDVVIRTTITQILPDGSRLVRKKTLIPESLGQAPTTAVNAPSQAVKDRPKVRVIRARVRFGAGFDQRIRRSNAGQDDAYSVRRVLTQGKLQPLSPAAKTESN